MIEQVPFDIGAWVREVAEPGFAKARKKGLDVRLDVSPELPALIVGDATRIGQVLTNLIDNAVKFTSAGVVSVVGGAEPGARRPPHAARLGRRLRDRHRPRQARGGVREVPAGRQLHHAPLRRHGPGAGHLPPAGDADGRRHRPREHRGRGLHVLVRDSAGGGARHRAARPRCATNPCPPTSRRPRRARCSSRTTRPTSSWRSASSRRPAASWTWRPTAPRRSRRSPPPISTSCSWTARCR